MRVPQVSGIARFALTMTVTATMALWATPRAVAYGPEGHTIIGAVADARLAGTPAGTRVHDLLDGLSLAEVANIADSLRGWDKGGVDGPGAFRLPEHPALERQLRAFWTANPSTRQPRSHDDSEKVPSHTWFHYTDVPVAARHTYADGKVGRSRWDVVQMIDYCVDVLGGRIPENNPRAITRGVAIVLLAHYVGDLHQPLHVGAEYFDRQGRPVDPAPPVNGHVDWLEDQGGNTLKLELSAPAVADPVTGVTSLPSLHYYWDTLAVHEALDQLAGQLARGDAAANAATARAGRPGVAQAAAWWSTHEPADWKIAADAAPDTWAEHWADSMMPAARQAHLRLTYRGMDIRKASGGDLATGVAVERAMPDGVSYRDWSGRVTGEHLATAGWRLAALLERVLAPASAPAAPVPARAKP